ncbi:MULTISPECIES: Bax inhibitor-1/YccA family protein [unclassified Sporolactobacillus]|uniref:Bax inhibitor-1/YccA family protein n=1 Tax=unclassified Sporolactobacillus TaxID=2628533 RepID=UPI002368A45E|nr:Bax inhibitor-1/YccA family protein [Sporolactobacillus sp. CQH2019]MDD9150880.1 Bax inhibitor-1/YccA family protein [Sporolactobacillus sp. CQH2019]
MAEFSSQTLRKPYSKLFAAFFSGLLVTTAGLYFGQYVSPVYMMPLMIAEIGMIVMMMFVRKRQSVGYLLMYAFMFISGLTLFSVISYYASLIGATVVLEAFTVTTVSFGAIAVYTMVSKRDFTFLGSFLFLGLIALLAVGVFGIFIPFSSTTMMVYSGMGILIFIGYTLFDFSRLTVHGFTDKDIPMIVVSIYLDFINLFLYILQFIGIGSKN